MTFFSGHIHNDTTSTTVEVEVLGRNEEDHQVTGDKSGEDTEITPPVAELVAERGVELVANLVGAVLACLGGVVEEITRSTAGEEVAHVRSAFLALWGLELVEFSGCALNGEVVEFGDNHASDEAGEGVEFVEPDAPELGDGGLGDRDTAEEGENDLGQGQ